MIDEKIKVDIIAVLEQAIVLLGKDDFAGLIEVSNHTTHNASIFQDEYSIQIAVVIYALSKILERAKVEGQRISINVVTTLKRALEYLKKNDVDSYAKEIRKVFKQVSEKDEKLHMYIKSIVEKAHIVKGSRLYSHGLSVARTAEILGVNQWDLMSFIGKTKISDDQYSPGDVAQRIGFTKKLFKVL